MDGDDESTALEGREREREGDVVGGEDREVGCGEVTGGEVGTGEGDGDTDAGG